MFHVPFLVFFNLFSVKMLVELKMEGWVFSLSRVCCDACQLSRMSRASHRCIISRLCMWVLDGYGQHGQVMEKSKAYTGVILTYISIILVDIQDLKQVMRC